MDSSLFHYNCEHGASNVPCPLCFRDAEPLPPLEGVEEAPTEEPATTEE